MPRSFAACEELDDEHAAAAAGAWPRRDIQLLGLVGDAVCRRFSWLRGLGHGDAEQLACACNSLAAMAVGEEAIVPDAVEALRKHVDQEPPDELVRVQRHRLPAAGVVGTIILPAKGDAAVVGGDEAAVRDGDPVRVAREIAQHLLRSGKGGLQ